MVPGRLRSAWLAALALITWSCAAEDGANHLGCGDICRAVIAVEPGAVTVSLVDLEPGDAESVDVTITNVGTMDLHLTSVTLVYQSPDDTVEPAPAIRLVDDVPELPLTLPPLGELQLALLFTRPGDDAIRAAELRVESDDPSSPALVIPITATTTATRQLRQLAEPTLP